MCLLTLPSGTGSSYELVQKSDDQMQPYMCIFEHPPVRMGVGLHRRACCISVPLLVAGHKMAQLKWADSLKGMLDLGHRLQSMPDIMDMSHTIRSEPPNDAILRRPTVCC